MDQHLIRHGAALHHTAVLCDIPPQHGDAAGSAVRIVHGTDGFRIPVHRSLQILSNRLSRHSHQIGVEQSAVRQLLHHRLHAAGLIEILDVGRACGSQVAVVGGSGAHLVDGLQIHGHSRLVGDGQQVEHAVGAASQSHICGQSVLKSRRRQDIPGL